MRVRNGRGWNLWKIKKQLSPCLTINRNPPRPDEPLSWKTLDIFSGGPCWQLLPKPSHRVLSWGLVQISAVQSLAGNHENSLFEQLGKYCLTWFPARILNFESNIAVVVLLACADLTKLNVTDFCHQVFRSGLTLGSFLVEIYEKL
ncbi:hypothetical protein NQ317_013581 [Molorchus minor]|uniref:Uncharacterized protein n=1 Tax=Molorchus minor TaxID=1323400 RepID=A0ABQ9IU64_9CUCU|nr:hypothetical protein NQ317_013581 [Molorchus minor]